MKAYELLSQPGAWTQRTMARDKYGEGTAIFSSNAVCWCVMGAIKKIYPGNYFDYWGEVEDALRTTVQDWNDAPERTQEDAVALLKELNI